MQIRQADPGDVAALVDLAARTFALACPPRLSPENIERFIAEQLNREAFAGWLADPDARVSVGTMAGEVSAYLVALNEDESMFISKCYVAPEFHGQGLADALMREGIAYAHSRGVRCLRLGVNQANTRAIRFYQRHGFTIVGERTFTVGDQIESDHVLELALTSA